MIVFKAGLALLLIGILLYLVALAAKNKKLCEYCITGFAYAICLAIFMMFFGYILGMITGAIPVIKVL